MLTIDHCERILDRIHEWIRAADQKISIFLAFQGIVITLFVSSVAEWLRQAFVASDTLGSILLIGAIVSFCYSFYKIFRALIPQLVNVHVQKSMTFFGDIASIDLTTFSAKLNTTTEDDLRNDFIQQAFVSAKIASAKHVGFQTSVRAFLLGCGLVLAEWVLLNFGIYVR